MLIPATFDSFTKHLFLPARASTNKDGPLLEWACLQLPRGQPNLLFKLADCKPARDHLCAIEHVHYSERPASNYYQEDNEPASRSLADTVLAGVSRCHPDRLL